MHVIFKNAIEEVFSKIKDKDEYKNLKLFSIDEKKLINKDEFWKYFQNNF